MPCRNGSHLENCEKFECNVMFKCPNYYRVPWTYVCDGKWDCPYGEDEYNIEVCIGKSVCEKMFKCRNEHRKCISVSNVCDNQLDCLHHDDEMFCELKLLQCPFKCNFLVHTITCIDLQYDNSHFHLSATTWEQSNFIMPSLLSKLSYSFRCRT